MLCCCSSGRRWAATLQPSCSRALSGGSRCRAGWQPLWTTPPRSQLHMDYTGRAEWAWTHDRRTTAVKCRRERSGWHNREEIQACGSSVQSEDYLSRPEAMEPALQELPDLSLKVSTASCSGVSTNAPLPAPRLPTPRPTTPTFLPPSMARSVLLLALLFLAAPMARAWPAGAQLARFHDRELPPNLSRGIRNLEACKRNLVPAQQP